MDYRRYILFRGLGFGEAPPPPEKPRYWINLVLLLATVVTTLMAGARMAGVDLWAHPEQIYRGAPFSFTLLLILGVHELGHYFMSKSWGIKTTLPYFIPAPFFLGTFGAFIKIKSGIVNRKALLDIGATGPLAGFAVSIPVLIIGLKMSSVVNVAELERGALILGESLFFSFLSKAVLGNIPEGYGLSLNPMAFAGWLGLFITTLNLLPIGQLDGGHIAYSLLGRKQALVAMVTFFVLFPLGLLWPGWLFWAMLSMFMGLRHPPPLDDVSELDPKRKVVGILTFAIFVLCFMPVPIKV